MPIKHLASANQLGIPLESRDQRFDEEELVRLMRANDYDDIDISNKPRDITPPDTYRASDKLYVLRYKADSVAVCAGSFKNNRRGHVLEAANHTIIIPDEQTTFAVIGSPLSHELLPRLFRVITVL